ncbi:sporulation peptidase YabG [Massilibacterium senegalense]|uniref:sporulation peptidase YabG n=1 Tax=Massilibacterium senegalense TaxID=1632858 RepID=UPI0007830DDE|nr:sporulation peptidase YabG [Massilibacterium senegalense]
MQLKVGTMVARKSYGCDILFRITELDFENKIAILCGEDIRLVADAPFHDLVFVDEREKQKHKELEKKRQDETIRMFRQHYRVVQEKMTYLVTDEYTMQKSFFELPGQVLHIDGDAHYLSKCEELYKKLGVPFIGFHMTEEEMVKKVPPLFEQYQPHIIVITGHDAYLKQKGEVDELKAYRHTRFFIETVKKIRKRTLQLDYPIIFAGACQSHFEKLIRAGANFASSPARVNIHALDPVYIAAKCSYTPITEYLNVWEVLKHTITGEKGVGGIDTKGTLRTGMPFKK